MSSPKTLQTHYPWTGTPVLASAPMRLISLGPLALAVSHAGGLGFIGAGSDTSTLSADLAHAKSLLDAHPIPSTPQDILPIGVGFLNWGAELAAAIAAIQKYRPAAVWLFAPRRNEDLVEWTRQTREVTGGATRVWIQVGTVADAVEVTRLCRPDVLVVQGADAGGHGLEQGAGVVSLLPEVADALEKEGGEMPILVAAGGIGDGRGVAACVALGAAGVVMGTAYLASEEAKIAKGYQDEVIRATDGGVSTVRSKVYDSLRGTTEWPGRYGGRGLINQSYIDSQSGVAMEQNKVLYESALKQGDQGWGVKGRLTTYAGTGVGLVRTRESAGKITERVRSEAYRIIKNLHSKL